jgi:hypothetical protein
MTSEWWSAQVKKYYVECKRWASGFLYVAKYFMAVLLATAINNLVVQLADNDDYTTMVYLGYTCAVSAGVYLVVYLPRRLGVKHGHALLVISTVWLWNLMELLVSDFSIAVINYIWKYGTWTNVYVTWIFVAISIVAGVLGVYLHHLWVRETCSYMHNMEHPKLDYDDARQQIDDSIARHHASKKEELLLGMPYRLSTPDESDDFTLDEGTTHFGAKRQHASLLRGG